MSQPAAPIAAAGAAVSTGFLVELDTVLSFLVLYGEEHPAFGQRAAVAASAVAQQGVRVSVGPKGFYLDKALVEEERLLGLSQRLRALGLVGLSVETGLTAAQVMGLALTLRAAERERVHGEALAQRVAAVTEQRVRMAPLRLGGLRYVNGAGQDGAESAAAQDAAAIVQELFAQTFEDALGGGGNGGGGAGGGMAGRGGTAAAAAELARTFERAMRGEQGGATWNSVMGVWLAQLTQLGPLPQTGEAGGAARGDPSRLESIAGFLRALSPILCRRLLSETVGHRSTPEAVALELAARLPTGVILGALSAVDRTSAAPSKAALALLRKIASNLSPERVQAETPRTNRKLAEVAESLEQLLGSKNEGTFVPNEYLDRRQELSNAPLGLAADAKPVEYPDEAQTARHAAELAFQILATADLAPGHLSACLAFLKQRVTEWVRVGEFALVSQAIAAGQRLSGHEEKEVAETARSVASSALDVRGLIEGSRHCSDRATAVQAILKLLRQDEGGIALTSILCSAQLSSGEAAGGGVLVDAVKQFLPTAQAGWVKRLVEATAGKLPTGLLGMIGTMGEADAVRVSRSIMPHVGAGSRRAVAEALFRAKFKWPLDLIDELLKDAEVSVRRLALMRLVRDAELSAAAGVLREASRHGAYAVDVAVGLADLLYPQRRRPEVRGAYRQWFWSRRRWRLMLSVTVGDWRDAA